jgi:protein-L-isoaspartate(D-aspartate) O-methyltransferase
MNKDPYEERPQYKRARERMLKQQLLNRDIRDAGVLDAVRIIPRHLFVPPEHQMRSYEDRPLPIGGGQTISQPYIVALMTQILALKGDEKVLEVGTGSGYQAAILGYLAREVHTVERNEELIHQSSFILGRLGFDNVHVHTGDGSLGWPPEAPYDAIIVTAAAPLAPPPLLEQLAQGGRMVIPVGGPGNQMLERWERSGPDYTHEALVPVAFVPLLGQYGWEEDWS